MIYKALAASEINLNIKEVLRYSSIKSTPTPEELELLNICASEVVKAAKPKAIYEIVSIREFGESEIDFSLFKVHSKNLKKNISGCKNAIIFAATLGYDIERLILKYKLDSARLLFTNSAASALIEDFSNIIFSQLKSELAEKNLFLRPRFSPGYGDFALKYQKDIFSSLYLEKRLGITLTEDFFMVPSKSVTAICAISDSDLKCSISGCETCNMRTTCSFCRI